jgi:hypothetical protein
MNGAYFLMAWLWLECLMKCPNINLIIGPKLYYKGSRWLSYWGRYMACEDSVSEVTGFFFLVHKIL